LSWGREQYCLAAYAGIVSKHHGDRRKQENRELNRLIDSMMHPFFPDQRAVLADSLVHLLVEKKDLPTWVRELIRNNLKDIIASLDTRGELEGVVRALKEMLSHL